MALDNLIEKLPVYASDLKLNLSTILRQTELNQEQLWGAILAAAMACGNSTVISEVHKECAAVLTPAYVNAAKAAAAIMGMNNVYYRFHHLSTNVNYRTIPARLRMNILRSHGAEPADFELWCLAVSAINACAACVDAHEKVLKEKGWTDEKILSAVRAASIVHAISNVLTAEAALERTPN
jgi:lipoyl-dependent peroxiredoxin subunit D